MILYLDLSPDSSTTALGHSPDTFAKNLSFLTRKDEELNEAIDTEYKICDFFRVLSSFSVPQDLLQKRLFPGVELQDLDTIQNLVH